MGEICSTIRASFVELRVGRDATDNRILHGSDRMRLGGDTRVSHNGIRCSTTREDVSVLGEHATERVNSHDGTDFHLAVGRHSDTLSAFTGPLTAGLFSNRAACTHPDGPLLRVRFNGGIASGTTALGSELLHARISNVQHHSGADDGKTPHWQRESDPTLFTPVHHPVSSSKPK